MDQRLDDVQKISESAVKASFCWKSKTPTQSLKKIGSQVVSSLPATGSSTKVQNGWSRKKALLEQSMKPTALMASLYIGWVCQRKSMSESSRITVSLCNSNLRNTTTVILLLL